MECIEAYSHQLQTTRGDVLAVTTNNGTTPNNTLIGILRYNKGSKVDFSG